MRKIKDAEIDKAPALVEQTTKAVAVKPEVSPELLERISEVKENLQAVEEFRIPRIRMTATGAEITDGEDPVNAIEGTILHAKKTNVYYSKPYNPSDVQPPDCFSLDGELPDPSVKEPVNKTCKGCPMAEFGTNSMKSGKACRNLKPIYFLLGDDAIMPRQLTISPTSLKAANAYLMDLTASGYNYRKVKTRIEFYKENAKDTFARMKFKKIGVLDAQKAVDTMELLNMWRPLLDKQMVGQDETESAHSQEKTAEAQSMAGDY